MSNIYFFYIYFLLSKYYFKDIKYQYSNFVKDFFKKALSSFENETPRK